jgi:uncharacterized protein with gpF-like domain
MRPNKDKPVVVRAIHPNAGVQAWYRAELDAAIAAMHKDVLAGVLAAYSAGEPVELAKDAPPKNPSLFIRRALERYGRKWTLRLDALSLDLSRKFATKSFNLTQVQMKAAFKDAGFTVKFQPTPGSIAAYQAVAAEQVNLIRSIPAQYLKDVQSKVWKSVMKGSDLHTLSADLHETYGVTRERAALISRDQNAKAKAVIEKTRRQEIGITHAVWMHSAGGKVPRKTHVAMDGKPYLISQGMWDSDEGEYVLPGELINCRCTSKAVLPFVDKAEVIARTRASRPVALLNAARARAR